MLRVTLDVNQKIIGDIYIQRFSPSARPGANNKYMVSYKLQTGDSVDAEVTGFERRLGALELLRRAIVEIQKRTGETP